MPAQMPAQMPAPQPGAVGGGDGRGGMRGGGMRGRGRGGFRGGGGYGGGFIMPGGFRGGRGMRGKFSLFLFLSLSLSLSLALSLALALTLALSLSFWICGQSFFFGGGHSNLLMERGESLREAPCGTGNRETLCRMLEREKERQCIAYSTSTFEADVRGCSVLTFWCGSMT